MRKVIRRHIRRSADGVDLDVDVNAVFAVNSGTSAASSVQSTTVQQSATARAAAPSGEGPKGGARDESRKEKR